MLNKVLTYIFLAFLSIVIIYPLLITASSAFRVGNVAALHSIFRAHGHWTTLSGCLKRRFTSIGTGNTLVIALSVMVFQVTIVTLAGYTYSRYRFAGRKSLIFFLIIQMVPTMAALTALRPGHADRSFGPILVLTAIYIGGGIPMNTWLMKGYFDTVPREIDEAA